jgi:predicted site-specific integrase-resolvase
VSIRDDTGLLTAEEVAARYQVALPTAVRWGRQGHLLTVPGPDGPRFLAVEVAAMLGGEPAETARKLAEAERDRPARDVQ